MQLPRWLQDRKDKAFAQRKFAVTIRLPLQSKVEIFEEQFGQLAKSAFA
jgi:hypothetical protein